MTTYCFRCRGCGYRAEASVPAPIFAAGDAKCCPDMEMVRDYRAEHAVGAVANLRRQRLASAGGARYLREQEAIATREQERSG